MRVLIDICHPAHAHFFRHPVDILRKRGHEVLITSRVKEVAIPLLESFGWEHRSLSSANSGRLSGVLMELVKRDYNLRQVVKSFGPQVMAAVGGTFVAQVGFLTGTRSVVFYDTEEARIQNCLTYPFATLVAVPACYRGWLPARSQRYDGYHESSYLHPDRFSPSLQAAVANGVDPTRPNFLIRVVAWKANHDIGMRGWSVPLLEKVVRHLARRGNVLISSEGDLPPALRNWAYVGDPLQIHHVMAHCRLVVGESATMASEAAVLGVPALFVARTWRGYTDEQEHRYGLVRTLRELGPDGIIEAIDELLAIDRAEWPVRRDALLNDTIDVAGYVASLLEAVGESRKRDGNYE